MSEHTALYYLPKVLSYCRVHSRTLEDMFRIFQLFDCSETGFIFSIKGLRVIKTDLVVFIYIS